MTQTATASKARPPHPLLTLTEGRAVFELGWFVALRRAMKRLPKGDGHAVIVLPGFLAGDTSTRPMRGLLKDLGYVPYGWDLGRNLRFNSDREQALYALLDRVHEESGRPVSLIGWSLGGLFAREIAKRSPNKVRQVISLGSPLSNDRGYTSASRLFERLNGRDPEPMKQGRFQALDEAPPVPTTSILSRSDGIVAWRASVQKPGPQAETLEVLASHCGLGVNPMVMYAIADRLAQAEGAWQPFDRSGWRSMLFRTVEAD
ncbi:esterase/lipase family protein [Blastomonas aquatica]|uniref:Alpha/beta hydrolase n=1 Tax=Blastomonas aquatica TaxID=1510276 RepID=A0ABQ1JEY6_9SPHN|nr:alpha/beta fold hydrolase [Blastomonas aquatica]GGB64683.1 alpha/beta hydrolase [Blastomonas aquatica]